MTVRNTVKAHVLLMNKIPEDTVQLRSILVDIEQKNVAQVMGADSKRAKWPNSFIPECTHCILCSSALTSPSRLPGSDGRSYLLTRSGLLTVSVNIKRCTNCYVRYSYSEWKEGN